MGLRQERHLVTQGDHHLPLCVVHGLTRRLTGSDQPGCALLLSWAVCSAVLLIVAGVLLWSDPGLTWQAWTAIVVG